MRRFTIAEWLGLCRIACVLLAGGTVLPGLCPCGPAIAADIIPADRRIDWSPGIPGGIPIYPVGINVKDAPYSAKGDGVTDDTAAIQAAIRDCPAGKAVYLPAGTYRTKSELEIKGKGVVIRGAGPTQTRIRRESTNGQIIAIYNWSNGGKRAVVGGFQKGSTTLTLANMAGVTAGQHVIIDEDNDLAALDRVPAYCERVLAQMAFVKAVEGNTVTLSRPLYFTYNPLMHIQFSIFAGCFNAGVEDLCVDRAVAGGGDNILINCAANCWVKNVESCRAYKWHVRLKGSLGCEVRNCYIHDGWNAGGDGDYGVGCFERSTDNLIENNVFRKCRHAMILEDGGCGNVYGYNYSRDPINEGGDHTDFLMADMDLHGGNPYMNLFEGNIAAHIGCDNSLGGSRYNTFFRNWIERKSLPTVKYGCWGIEVQMNNLYENLVGNCVGRQPAYQSVNDAWHVGYDRLTATIDPRVTETILRHGNYDETTGKTEWDGKIEDHTLPASLYLKAKPAFFGDHPWPAIGPDVDPQGGFLPAKDRYDCELSKQATR